ncbi:E6 [Capra hircus papillomavirus 1]|uniref:Protein E6 n=1 Tax=Capra hircus papillomavirus 1 TaxID=338903 RepID=Q1I127_9PAPI|nr:E6 [Capra hircus papillomavirus 1]AAZ39801.1 E6 [Capra hircus papillomavirus 1]
MTFVQPRRISDLATVLGLLPEELVLPCNFCRAPLSVQDLHLFDQKYFQLLYKYDGVYAFCSACARALAEAEHSRFCDIELSGSDMVAIVRAPLHRILVRCRKCFKLLSFVEKLGMIYCGLNFCSVRSWWRGVCRYCRQP